MATTRQLLTKHYTRILAHWPQDLLRPETPFQSLLHARIRTIPTLTDAQASAELRNVNALYSLMDHRYSRKVRLTMSCLLQQQKKHKKYIPRISETVKSPARSGLVRFTRRLDMSGPC
jgi:cytochrome b pre-mRNA-processing protein 6